MSSTIGDGMVSLALAGGIVGYLYLKHQSRQQRMEIIHKERLVAMEKGIPLPEFPVEQEKRGSDPDNVIPILGIILSTLSIGTMIVLYFTLDADSRSFWVAPLPFAFMGVGLVGFHLLNARARR